MGFIGFIISLAAGAAMLLGLIPFLGWFNWFTTLPLAVIGAAISGIALARKNKSVFAIIGLIISIIVLVIGSGRLWIGCGII